MSNVPSELKYSKSHEWVKLDGDIATVGITDHAQEELGDIVYVELPEVGRVLAYDDVFGTVESVKAVSELYSPLAGEVVAVNETLTDDPANNGALINSTPYEDGWMLKIRVSDPDALAELLDAEGYKSEIGE
ncbi:glycine cleavage system protein GcvH [Armatimonas rosea]|uniref:Glycine cleavage system H protein n=1 Tax=Armatimonas rosea TaxID=685828 RepID=A0A7W9STU2_ARMRO|nr:glycine cleavage system protein GcvH [Armatimonas rosea]MBB6052551.1 glycine cleavage system H protein [Armatimonas rosea]